MGSDIDVQFPVTAGTHDHSQRISQVPEADWTDESGEWCGRFPDGSSIVVGIQDGVFEGPYRIERVSGRAEYGSMRNGVRHGDAVHGRGDVNVGVVPFRHGVTEGFVRLSWPDANMTEISHYVAGVQHGVWEIIRDGVKLARAVFDSGVAHGCVEGWYANGVECFTGSLKTGRKDGEWTFWGRSGCIAASEVWSQGQLIRRDIHDTSIPAVNDQDDLGRILDWEGSDWETRTVVW